MVELTEVHRPVESYSGARENIIAGPYLPHSACLEIKMPKGEETWGGVSPHHLPYILAYKSQNLGQNLAPKIRGATYPRVIK